MLAVLAGWLVVTAGLRLVHRGAVLPGTAVGGVNVGGLSAQDARAEIAGAYPADRPITLVAGRRRFIVTARQAGYALDLTRTVDRALGAGRSGARGLWSPIVGLVAGRRVSPAVTIDGARLTAQVDEIAADVDEGASAGALAIDVRGDSVRVSARAPTPGRSLDRGAARAALLGALRERRPGDVALAVRRLPTVTRDAVETVARRARSYVEAPLRLRVGDRTTTVRPARVARVLALERTSTTSRRAVRLGVDAAALDKLVAALARDLDRDSKSARVSAPQRPGVVLDGQADVSWKPRRVRLSVAAAAPGRKVDRAAAAAAIAAAVRSGRHDAALALTPIEPVLSTSAARKVTTS